MQQTKSYDKQKFCIVFPVLVLYIFIVFSLQLVSIDVDLEWWSYIGIGAASFASACACFWVFDYLYVKVKLSYRNYTAKAKWLLLAVAVVLLLLSYLGAFFLRYFPGLFTTDALNQIEQAETGNYNNWHPALHTFLFFTLPLATGSGEWTIVFFQILYFALAVTYLMKVLLESKIPLIVYLALLAFVVLNLPLIHSMMYPNKDMALVVFCLLVIAYTIKIYASKGEWLSPPHTHTHSVRAHCCLPEHLFLALICGIMPCSLRCHLD